MESSEDREHMIEVIARLAPPFFEEGHKKVYAAMCCDRVMVTVEKTEKCRTCGGVPDGIWITPEKLKALTEGDGTSSTGSP